MSAMQKHAWFNLAVVLLSLCAVVLLASLIGVHRAQAGLGFLGLLGLGPLFLRGKRVRVVADERDTLIQRRSVIAGYTAVWMALVIGGCLLAPALYGMEGAVPVAVIMVSVAYVVMVLVAVMSVATLIQYGRR